VAFVYPTTGIGADVVGINAGLTSGNNATLSLAALNITNSGGTAVTIASSGSNGHGVLITANGTGEGVNVTGGATGSGIESTGGSTSGSGIMAAAGATAGDGLKITGTGAGEGIKVTAGATGVGFEVTGGATSGAAMSLIADGTNDNAVTLTPIGTGVGIAGSGLAIQKNIGYSNFQFKLVDSGDNKTPETGLTPTVQVMQDGGTFAASTNAAVEDTVGWYHITFTAAEMNADVIVVKVTATGANTVEYSLRTNP
jgi:hypothetical protein